MFIYYYYLWLINAHGFQIFAVCSKSIWTVLENCKCGKHSCCPYFQSDRLMVRRAINTFRRLEKFYKKTFFLQIRTQFRNKESIWNVMITAKSSNWQDMSFLSKYWLKKEQWFSALLLKAWCSFFYCLMYFSTHLLNRLNFHCN